jgi:hypothetical protein
MSLRKKPQKTKYRRYKLLLDENVGSRSQYPTLNNLHDIKHIKLDFHRGGISDTDVYTLGREETRLIVTVNEKHFYPLKEMSKDTGIIILSPNLTFQEADIKLCALLRRKTHKELYGKLHKISKWR